MWGTKSLDDENTMVMAAEVTALKGHLKAHKMLGDTLKEGGKKKKKATPR